MIDFETNPIGTAKRIEKLEAMMKWADEISNIQASRIEELEAKLAKAVRALQFISCDENVEGRHAIFTLAELEGRLHGED